MSDLDNLNKDLAELSDLRSALATEKESIAAESEVLLAPLASRRTRLAEEQERYDALRQQVLFQLRLNKLETVKNDRVTAYITQKPKVRIEEPDKVIKWIESAGLAADEYMTKPELDKARIEHLQVERMNQDGEIIDGLSFEMEEILNVRDRKEKK